MRGSGVVHRSQANQRCRLSWPRATGTGRGHVISPRMARTEPGEGAQASSQSEVRARAAQLPRGVIGRALPRAGCEMYDVSRHCVTSACPNLVLKSLRFGTVKNIAL